MVKFRVNDAHLCISETYMKTGKYRNWENTRNYVYLYVYLHKHSESEVVIACYLCCGCYLPVIGWHRKCWSPVDINKLFPSSWRILIVHCTVYTCIVIFLCFLQQRMTQQDGGVKWINGNDFRKREKERKEEEFHPWRITRGLNSKSLPTIIVPSLTVLLVPPLRRISIKRLRLEAAFFCLEQVGRVVLQRILLRRWDLCL
jgi:hypothetical protein